MEKRIASFKVSSLLTLFLSVFFAFSVTSCGGNDPVDDINLVGTAWKGFCQRMGERIREYVQ